MQTQAFQLWADRSAERARLGARRELGGRLLRGAARHLLRHEPPDPARVLGAGRRRPDDRLLLRRARRPRGRDAAEATERAKRNAIDFIENDLGTLWPGARARRRVRLGRARRPDGGAAGRSASTPSTGARTSPPWERYVLTPAGSVEHRLPSGDSGFENLSLAGDWTSNGIDGGCVEAAVISGIDAARALSRLAPADPRQRAPAGCGPRSQELPPTWSSAAAPRRRRPSPARAAACSGLLLEGDGERIDGSSSACSTRPAGSAIDYRSLGSHVLLLLGELRPRHLAHAALRPLGRGARDPGLVLDPRAGRPRPGRLFLAERAAARRALHLRRQPDVLPGRPRDLRLREDDGPLRPRRAVWASA